MDGRSTARESSEHTFDPRLASPIFIPRGGGARTDENAPKNSAKCTEKFSENAPSRPMVLLVLCKTTWFASCHKMGPGLASDRKTMQLVSC